MSEAAGLDTSTLLWTAGWIAAVCVLALIGLRAPARAGRGLRARLYGPGLVLSSVALGVLAVVALTLHDAHLDLTREKAYTPSMQAMQAVDAIDRPVNVTYFYRSQDPEGRRAKDILLGMARRNALLQVKAVDPDKEPALAETYGIRLYNAGLIEAESRRVLVNTTDEAEIALGIQRVLRHKRVVACFAEGHNELPMDNFEFHTHLEGASGHSHGDASSSLVQMSGHGAGRLRRALEGQGFEARRVVLATMDAVPADCTVLIDVNPRTTFLPRESVLLESYLRQGGSAMLLLDLGFSLEPRLAALLESLGVRPLQRAVVDPLSHYANQPEIVAVSGYEPHPITKPISMTFFPGVRPLELVPAASGVHTLPLFTSSGDSFERVVQPAGAREVMPTRSQAMKVADASAKQVLAVGAEGTLAGSTHAFRAVVVGDADFASNSFFPYLANSDLALSMVRWLAREEHTVAVTTRVPVPPMILLSAAQTRVVFLGSVVALPLLPMALGVFVWWRRR